MNMTVILIVLLAIYIVAMIFLGYIGSKRANSVSSYATSNGDIGPVAAAFAFAATFASAGTFLGVAGQGFAYGVTNLWFWASQWFPCGVILLIICRRYRKMNKHLKSATVADWVADRYDSQGSRVFLALVSMLQILAIGSQLVGSGIIINHVIPVISYPMAVVISAVVVMVYICMGGTYAHVYTNVAQGAMMLVLAIVLVLSGVFVFGNLLDVPNMLAEIDPNLAKGLNPDNSGYPSMIYIVGLFIAHMWWTMNPQLIGKCTYLKKERDVKKFLLLSCLFMFLMCSITMVGGYTRVLIPEGIGDTVPGMDYAVPTYISMLFPDIVSAVFLIVIMAATMSTIDGMLLYVSSVIGNTWYKNIYVRHQIDSGKQVDETKADNVAMQVMRWSTIVVGIVAIPIALSRPENLTVLLWAGSGTIMSAVAGPVCIGLYSKKAGKGSALLGSVGGFLSFVIIYFGGLIGSVYLCSAIGGTVSVILSAIGTQIFKPMDQARAEAIFAGISPAKK